MRTRSIKIVIEKHADGYVGYVNGVKGVIVGEGETFDEALTDTASALKFHVDAFGTGVVEARARRG